MEVNSKVSELLQCNLWQWGTIPASNSSLTLQDKSSYLVQGEKGKVQLLILERAVVFLLISVYLQGCLIGQLDNFTGNQCVYDPEHNAVAGEVQDTIWWHTTS